MNILTRSYHRALVTLKAARMRWSGTTRTWWGANRSRYDYASQVAPRNNSIVEAVVGWLCRTFPEAPLQVVTTNGKGDVKPVNNHAMIALVRRPNPFYSGILLWQATLADWLTDGNAYWLKVRSGGGRVVELWWLPASQVAPAFPDDGSRFLDGYDYTPGGGEKVRYGLDDVVHFRNGLDPENPRKGRSPLKSLLREIFTDDEAANFSAALLRNMGVPGVVIAPDSDVTPTQEELDHTKAEFAARFGGDNRGAPLVMMGKAKVTILSFTPEQMNLSMLRRVPEERIAAIYGVSVMVVGLGAGLEHSTYSNYEEARQAAYESNIIPTQSLLAAELETQLLPDFGDNNRTSVAFDNSGVRVLQPDLDALFARLDVAVRGGWMRPNEAREKVGLDPLPDGDVIYLPISLTPTDPAELIPPEPVPMPLPDPMADPAALPAPAPLHALPPGKGQTKAAGANLAEALGRVRARHAPPLEKELANYLGDQRARVGAALAAQQKGINWRDLFDAVAEEKGLRRILDRWYSRVLDAVKMLTEDTLGVAFDLDDAATRAYLAEAGRLIGGITEHTRSDIARALQEGQAAGEGIPQLARRIEDLTAFNRQRAVTIARTELGTASQHAAVASYRASGLVTHVTVFDGTDDDDACRTANGQTWTLDEASKRPLEHPRCRRAFGPVVGRVRDGAA